MVTEASVALEKLQNDTSFRSIYNLRIVNVNGLKVKNIKVVKN